MWNGRRTKIIVDLAMTIFLILSFVRWEGDPTFHFIVGIACTLFFAVHVLIHRKWLRSVTRSYLAKKISPTLVGKYRVDILLLAVWGVCIVTGGLAVGALVGGIEWMFVFGRIHGLTARLGLLLTAIHIFQHRAQVLSYLNRRQSKKASAVSSRDDTALGR